MMRRKSPPYELILEKIKSNNFKFLKLEKFAKGDKFFFFYQNSALFYFFIFILIKILKLSKISPFD